MASSTQCRSDLPVRTPSATAWPNASRASLRDAPLRLGNGPGSKRCDNGLIRRSAREKLPAPCRINTSTWTNMLGKAKQCREILQATGLNHEAHLKTSTMSHTWPRKVELPEFSSWLFGAGLPTLPSADCSARVSRPCRPLTVRRVSRPCRPLDRYLPPGAGIGDLRSVQWQGLETLPQRGSALRKRGVVVP